MKYFYHVAYNHKKKDGSWGFGSSTVEVPVKLTTSEAINTVKDWIKSTDPSYESLVLINWILLRKER